MLRKIGIIGGTGVYELDGILSDVYHKDISTPYGLVEDLCIGYYGKKEIIFLSRHKCGHSVPPHRINYLANIFALKKLGVEMILATNAAGSIAGYMMPGYFIFVDDFVDLTKSRAGTFFEGEGANGVFHFDMTDPYCPKLRRILMENAKKLDIPYYDHGVLAVTEGPRFETAAEIRDFQKRGFHLVNMTGAPEVALAREAAMCYASICMVTNFCTGISDTPLKEEEVYEIMKKNADNLGKLLVATIESLPGNDIGPCGCRGKEGPIKEALSTVHV
jgi:5'-methylthioadenosine phosphorylase